MSDNHANSEVDRSGRATAPSLRDRILLALIRSTPSEYLPPPNDMSVQVDAVIEALPELNPDHVRAKYLKDWEEGYDEGYSAGGGGC